MRRRLGQSLSAGVSGTAVSLLRASRWGGAAGAPLAEAMCAEEGDFAAIGAALEAVLDSDDYAGWPLSIVLDDELVRLWEVTAPQGATRPADLAAAAAMRFHGLYGDAPEDWNIRADWRPGAPFFAAAPRALLALLERAAAARGVPVVAVVPHFIAAWNRWQGALKADAWFGLMHGQVLRVGAVEGGVLRAVRALPLPSGADHGWLTQTLGREALLLNLAAPRLLQLCGEVAPAWRQAPSRAGHIATAAFAPASAVACSPGAALARCGSRT
ncbi:hypothetical protein [Janthinobacterium sp.]|uniref:hypothetical protein n=1 Tax=Janthinobacterium sp. TaxID=1871054 RepID=UPI00293D42DD|nr:hypothetical protein [Janthinobacterium sp.]